MRARSLIEVDQQSGPISITIEEEHVRRTLDDAVAELERDVREEEEEPTLPTGRRG